MYGSNLPSNCESIRVRTIENPLWVLGICALICSCASTHNMKEGGESHFGGGYLVEEVSEGTFRIIAKTNVAQWSDYGTARRMWKKRAEEACNGKPYTEVDVKEYEYDESEGQPILFFEQIFFRNIVTVKEGLAVCSEEQ